VKTSNLCYYLLSSGLHPSSVESFLKSLKNLSADNGYINPIMPNGNYMYHLLYQSVTLHFVFMGFA
jgi:hypothetical protein